MYLFGHSQRVCIDKYFPNARFNSLMSQNVQMDLVEVFYSLHFDVSQTTNKMQIVQLAIGLYPLTSDLCMVYIK